MEHRESPDPEYVHAQFYDTNRFDAISDMKQEFGVTWKEMLEFGRCFLEAVDEYADDPEFAAEVLRRSDLDASLEVEAAGDLSLMQMLNQNHSDPNE